MGSLPAHGALGEGAPLRGMSDGDAPTPAPIPVAPVPPHAADERTDPLTGATVVITGGRQGRPNLPSGCPFCPGGLEAPEPYDVRWFPNRWPALPGGRSQVLLFAPDHARSLGDLGVEQVRRVVDLWAERTETMGARPDVAYVLLFENRGREVGATIDHPHGQLYAFDQVPPVARLELQAPDCAVCAAGRAAGNGERLVSGDDGWWAVVPEAPTWPYELLVAPHRHTPDLPATTGGEREALARLLGDVLSRLDQLFDRLMPYMLWIHQRPTDGGDWPTAHLHVHVAPILRSPSSQRYVAAGELGSGIWFNPVVPEAAAAALRRLPGSEPEAAHPG